MMHVGSREHIHDQFQGFLCSFSPSGVGKIARAHSYMLRRLDQVAEQLEEEFIHSVVDADKTIRENEEAFVSPQARLKMSLQNLTFREVRRGIISRTLSQVAL